MSDNPITDLDAANYAVDYFSWWMFHEEKRADEAEAIAASQSQEIARLTERCDAYKEALTFYAKLDNWKYRHAGYPCAPLEIAQGGATIAAPAGKSLGDAMDLGQRARAALATPQAKTP